MRRVYPTVLQPGDPVAATRSNDVAVLLTAAGGCGERDPG